MNCSLCLAGLFRFWLGMGPLYAFIDRDLVAGDNKANIIKKLKKVVTYHSNLTKSLFFSKILTLLTIYVAPPT